MSDQHGGPVMICATPVMRPGATRIGKIGTITLPRTMPVMTLAACGAGGLVGLAIALAIASGPSSIMYGLVFGGGAGWFLVTYSPLKGESMAKWILIQMNASRRGRYIDGERVTLAVGTAVLSKPPAGQVKLLRSSVRIPSSQYDERGVLISPKNRNVPVDGEIDPLLFAALALPGESRMSLTPTDGPTLGPKPNDKPARRAKTRRGSTSPSVTPPSPQAGPAYGSHSVGADIVAADAVAIGKPQRLKD